MKRKILDVTVLCIFCICLIVTANIEERSAKNACGSGQDSTEEYTVPDENDAPVAGVCRTLSMYSFTTESDEETGISKKQTALVTTSENNDGDEEVTEEDREDEGEAEESGSSAETVEAMGQAASNRWNITLTQDEIDLLAKIVWLESRGEPVEGQEAVVEVVFNRMTSGKFPTTVYGVLSQGNPVQFCSWKNRDQAQPTEKEYQSIQNVLDGKTSILRNDTLYFSTEPLTPRIDKKIGGHSFCY